MDCLEERYGANYAPNTRETFRRKVLHQFVQGCRLQPFSTPISRRTARAPITPLRKRPWRPFAVTERRNPAVAGFRREHGALAERYERERNQSR